MDLRKTEDPIKKQPEKGMEGDQMSPMDPPEAYAPPGTVSQVPYEEMSPLLRGFIDDHKAFKAVIDQLETAVMSIPKDGITRENDNAIRAFFEYLDHDFHDHNRKEEKALFPLLHKRLIEKGEHSNGPEKKTAVDALEDDHRKVLQQGSVIFNLLSLSHRLRDQGSRLQVLDLALEQSKDLIETLRLHIFREEQVVFPLAHGLISKEEFERI